MNEDDPPALNSSDSDPADDGAMDTESEGDRLDSKHLSCEAPNLEALHDLLTPGNRAVPEARKPMGQETPKAHEVQASPQGGSDRH